MAQNNSYTAELLSNLDIEMELAMASFKTALSNDDLEACRFHLDRFKEKMGLQEILLETLEKKYFQVYGRKIRPVTDPN